MKKKNDYQKKVNGLYEYGCDGCGQVYGTKFKNESITRRGQWQRAFMCKVCINRYSKS